MLVLERTIMLVLDHAWLRTECDNMLRTRLALHCRDGFDVVSKYLLALKAGQTHRHVTWLVNRSWVGSPGL